MLFSRMLALPKARRIEMERTEIGMDAATVRPARRPTYTVTAPKRTPKIAPRMSARAESSGRVSVVETKGLKVGLVGVDVAMIVRLPRWSSLVFGFDGVYQRGSEDLFGSVFRSVTLSRW